MKKVAAFFALFLCLLLAACTAKTPTEPASAEKEPESVSAEWFALSSDRDLITVSLEANPTTGYSWSYEISDEELLMAVTEEYVTDPSGEGLAGAGGIWQASFRPASQKEGDVKLTLKYGRPWENQPIFIKTLLLTVKGQKITVTDFQEMEKNLPMIPDGEYRVELNADSIQKDGDTITAEMTEMKPVVLSDEEVKALRAGDTIDLSAYAVSSMNVTKLEKRGDGSIEVNDYATLTKDGSLGGWKIVIENDDLISYPVSLGQAVFDKETVFTDNLSKTAYGDANKFPDIYECVKNYHWVNAVVTLENGHAKEVKVLYHP